MAQLSNALRTAMLNSQGVSELLTDGKIYVFAGTPPANADTALDMASTHTLLVVISDNGGADGLDFSAPANGVLSKAGAQTWRGVIDFVGAQSAAPNLGATFFRFCASGDNGQGAGGGTSYRIQGTAGGPTDGAELDVGSSALVDNGSNAVTLTVGNIRLPL